MGLIKGLISKDAIEKIKISFGKVENELNEHLDSINANTNEIQSIFEMMAEIDSKIDKLDSRIDQIQLKLNENTKKVVDIRIAPLTKTEKKVFLSLYTSEHEEVTYKDLAKKLNLEEVLVQEYITNLIAKGIPISKKFQGSSIFISLDKEFKEIQAKENIIHM